MRRIFTQRRSILTVAVAALAILAALTFALVKPHATRAFTLIELPAVQFGSVSVSTGSLVEVSTINWGDTPVTMLLGIVSASNTNIVLAHTQQTVMPGMGASLPYISNLGQKVAGIVAIANSGSAGSAGTIPLPFQSGSLNGSIGTSMQVTFPAGAGSAANSGSLLVLPPQLLVKATLPAALVTGGGGGN